MSRNFCQHSSNDSAVKSGRSARICFVIVRSAVSWVRSERLVWPNTHPNVPPIFSVRSGRSSPSIASYGGIPGIAPKNWASMSCQVRPGARSPNSRINDALR